ncbi:MAG: polysaccharide biosynthesis tyrosine autokinase [Alphaproteobacteria bacterium]|nr:polysaccharide biosynthesis tyrosine autokinase [Alphaproteobacteria bacterium]
MDDKVAQFNPQGDGQRTMVARAEGDAYGMARPNGAYPYYPQYGVDPLEAAPQQFDFYKHVRTLLKYRLMIISIVVSTLAAAALVTFLMTPVYRATASIQIDRETVNVTDTKSLQNEKDTGSNDFYQTKYELLASRSLAERVANSLGLADDPQFSTNSKSLLGMVLGLVSSTTEKSGQTLSIEDRKRIVVNTLVKNVIISPVRGSRIVKISYDHTVPSVAQKIVNGYADAFIADNLDRRYDATSYARKFLEDRLQQLKFKLEESEKQVVKYAETNGIINLDDNKNLAVTDLEAINAKLTEAHTNRVKAETLWKQAQATGGFGLKEILDSKAIQENQKLRTELAAQYQQKLAIYKPAFPDMVQLRNQIKELDRQIQSDVEAIKNSIKASFLVAQQEEDSLKTQLESVKSDVVTLRNSNISYTILKREADTNRTLYDGLLQRYKEIGVSGAVGTNNISVVDKATLPRLPQSPSLTLNLVLGLFTGLLLAIGLAYVFDYIDDSFKSPEDVESTIGVSVIGVIPKPLGNGNVEEDLANARSGISEAFRSLRTSLQFATSDGLPKSLLVTSSKPAEGKTTCSIALAKSLASIGLNVLLIDGDLRNSSVHRRMRCSNEMGLSNYLTGSKLPEEVVQSTEIEGLVLMAAGPLPPNPAELLAGPRFMSLLALGMESFDIVVIDGPPVMGLADAPLLASMTRATLLVIAANETRRNTVKVAFKRLQFARANLIGSLLSKFDAKISGYGYGYGASDYDYHSYGTQAQLPRQDGYN